MTSQANKKESGLQTLLTESPYRSQAVGGQQNRNTYARQSLDSARHIYTREYSRRVKRGDQGTINVQKTYEELLKENEQLKAQLITMTKLQSNGYLSFDPSITENLAVENKTYKNENERLQNLTLKQTKQIKALQHELLELKVAHETLQMQFTNNSHVYKETNSKLQEQQTLILQLKEQLYQQSEQINALKRLHDSRLDQSKSKDSDDLQKSQTLNDQLQSKVSELQKELLEKEQIIYQQENIIYQLRNEINEKSLIATDKKVAQNDYVIINENHNNEVTDKKEDYLVQDSDNQRFQDYEVIANTQKQPDIDNVGVQDEENPKINDERHSADTSLKEDELSVQEGEQKGKDDELNAYDVLADHVNKEDQEAQKIEEYEVKKTNPYELINAAMQ